MKNNQNALWVLIKDFTNSKNTGKTPHTIYNCLARAGITTIEDFIKAKDTYLESIRNVGPKKLEIILDAKRFAERREKLFAENAAKIAEFNRMELKTFLESAMDGAKTIHISVEKPRFDPDGFFHYNMRLAYCNQEGEELAVLIQSMDTEINSIEIPIQFKPMVI